MTEKTTNEASPDPNDVNLADSLNQAFATSDTLVVQRVQGLTSIRNARVTQLTREVNDLSAQYGDNDPQVMSLKATRDANQVVAVRLQTMHDQVNTPAPDVPAQGWVLHGRVRDSALNPLPAQTVLIVDEQKNWIRQYGYAFTDSTGYFLLTFEPADSKPSAAIQAAYVAVMNESKKLVYLDSAPLVPSIGNAVYRDIVVSSAPIGTPPTSSTIGRAASAAGKEMQDSAETISESVGTKKTAGQSKKSGRTKKKE